MDPALKATDVNLPWRKFLRKEGTRTSAGIKAPPPPSSTLGIGNLDSAG